ncbi:phage holin family protein [Aeromicrobium sp. NPDC092404]|uniref:phage holin family protein n=1 Tax=Aeromicrobium sp. NPDC092404 TaxID=3154976 RepID=UPI003432F3CE
MNRADDPTIGRLVADASRDISALVQSEIKLAKSELKFSVKAGGVGAGMLLVAGFFGLLIIILLSIAGAYFLTMTGLDPAWAFLIVAGGYFVLALLLIIIGIVLLKKIRAPERTIATAKEIPAALKGRTS